MNDMNNKNKKIKAMSMTRTVVSMLSLNSMALVLVVLAVAFTFSYREITSIYDEMAKSVAGEAFTQLDEDLIELLAENCHATLVSYSDPIASYSEDIEAFYGNFSGLYNFPNYRNMQAKLNDMKAGTHATEIDLVIMYPDSNIGVYIMDARDVTEISAGELFEIDSIYFEKDTKLFKGFYSKSRYFGTLRTNGVLVYSNPDKDLYTYLTVDIPTSEINSRLRTFIISTSFFALVCAILISLGVNYYLKKRISNPIMDVSAMAESFVDGYETRVDKNHNSNVFTDIKLGGITEVNQLLRSMQSMELEMNSYLNSLDAVTREQERIRTELDMAAGIQMAMLPDEFIQHDKFKIYASMTPVKEVGGDFYDFFMIDDDHLGLVMADVSGKGVPAAMFMTVSKLLVKNFALTGMSPGEVLSSVNNQICSNNKQDMFVTVWLGILTISTGNIVAANAGHEYPLIKNGERFELLKDKHGIVIGGMEDMKYKEYEMSLNSGDTLFLYTDGVAEATNSDNQLFGTDAMLEALNSNPDLNPKELLENMKTEVDRFVGIAPQFDDLTMMAIKIK